jgi:hypothetical protein
MTTRQISVQRLSMASFKSFESAVAALEAAVGHPNMSKFGKAMGASKTCAGMERIIRGALGKMDERPGGVHLSYNLKVAQDLDSKVEKLLAGAAA